ncbi:hypothetical protein LTR56_024243 [Elasticomyces elasticus]|nr:hypothetical protein LTR56_024243 [Elasticomyces elasticus]KAK3639683.1 hypothetical protein LTR22_017356 [Elasticomyces elasticus]KAK4913461.1 hypothetical protein LTR49_018257 [Elasticomyces elasticus]KAK5760969.1 hypothetical protein LTS12_008817 [Elasticomyces elasticus]
MSMPYFGASQNGQVLELHSGNVSLVIRQNPKTALVTVSKKEKNRKPIDPPPIVQMHVHDPNVEQSWLVSPYLFLIATLLAGEKGDDVLIGDQYVIGQSSSSLNRLKDVDNKDGGFFVFGDISVRKTGWYRLRFSLFNQNKSTHDVEFLTSVDSTPFVVQSNKDFGGLSESSHLSRTFSDQGVRLRLRKEQRKLTGQKRGYQSIEDSPEDHGSRRGALGSNDYGHGGPAPKRQRADSDYDNGTSMYGRAPISNYPYTGSTMASGGYGAYPNYDTQGYAYHPDQDYGGANLPETYHTPVHMMPNHFSSVPRNGGHDPGAISLGPLHDTKPPHAEQTSYFSGYPTPTKSGSYNPHLTVQSSELYSHNSAPQQHHFIHAGGGYMGGSNAQMGTFEPQHSNTYPGAQPAHLTQPVSTMSSRAYATAASTGEEQAYGTTNGYGGNSVLYPALDAVTTSGAMPSTPLTTSTLNSAFTAFGDDVKTQPPDPQPTAVYPGGSQASALRGVYDTR